MEEFNSTVELEEAEAEEIQEVQIEKKGRKKKESKHKNEKSKHDKNKTKGDWRGNPVIKGILAFIFFLLTIGTAIVTGIVINLAENKVYSYHPQDYLIYRVQERVLEENADTIYELLLEFFDRNDLSITTANINQYGDDMIAFIEDRFMSDVDDPFYRFSIFFFTDSDFPREVHGDQYSPYNQSYDDVVCSEDIHYSYVWTEEYSEKYTFDTYDAAVKYRYQLEGEAELDDDLMIQDTEIVVPEKAQYFDGYYPFITDGYQLVVHYEKYCKTEFYIDCELTDAYEYIPYYDRGHDLAWEIERINWMYEVKTTVLVVMGMMILALLVCFILLMTSAGHVHDSEEIRERWFEKIPMEVILAVIGLIIWGIIFIYHGVQASVQDDIMNVNIHLYDPYLIGYVSSLLLLSLFCCRTIVVRKKLDRIFQSSIICRFFIKHFGMESSFMKFQRYVSSKIPFMWKVILIYVVITLVEIIVLYTPTTAQAELYFTVKICITALVVVVASWLQELKKGGEELVAGNTRHKVNTRFMKWAFKKHGENLNNLNEGLQVAVEERMKSERMKTELITNVSHDIKTPLTSIINYVDLLQKQNITSEPEASYIDVLARQSARLKKLIDDLVEASKASSGTVTVEMKVMDANLVLAQATAEYIDKLAEKELRLVVSEASEPALIRADGRHLWRVIDNLLNNAYKYAMPGTRVYANIATIDDRVQITFKNISKDELNVSSDELMERFVRGDSSRNTEGSGLGLSIAKSLCQLMEADFNIEIDGDLYKAIITFDLMTEEDIEIEDILLETNSQ